MCVAHVRTTGDETPPASSRSTRQVSRPAHGGMDVNLICGCCSDQSIVHNQVQHSQVLYFAARGRLPRPTEEAKRRGRFSGETSPGSMLTRVQTHASPMCTNARRPSTTYYAGISKLTARRLSSQGHLARASSRSSSYFLIPTNQRYFFSEASLDSLSFYRPVRRS